MRLVVRSTVVLIAAMLAAILATPYVDAQDAHAVNPSPAPLRFETETLRKSTHGGNPFMRLWIVVAGKRYVVSDMSLDGSVADAKDVTDLPEGAMSAGAHFSWAGTEEQYCIALHGGKVLVYGRHTDEDMKSEPEWAVYRTFDGAGKPLDRFSEEKVLGVYAKPKGRSTAVLTISGTGGKMTAILATYRGSVTSLAGLKPPARTIWKGSFRRLVVAEGRYWVSKSTTEDDDVLAGLKFEMKGGAVVDINEVDPTLNLDLRGMKRIR